MPFYSLGDQIPVAPLEPSEFADHLPKSLDKAKSLAQRGPLLWAVSALMASYVVLGVEPLAFFLALASLYLSRSASRRTFLMMLAINPMILFPLICGMSVIPGYYKGSARMHCSGYPGSNFSNLDPQLRCYRKSLGCCPTSAQRFYGDMNNILLRTMIQSFGPMPGTYIGPYPSDEEALDLIQGSEERICYEDFIQCPERYAFPSDRTAALLQSAFADSEEKVALRIYENQTLIVGNETRAVLIALNSGQTYARYDFSGLIESRRWREQQKEE